MFRTLFASFWLSVLTMGVAQAAIIGVSGPSSSAGGAPRIIDAPPAALDDIVTNTAMQGFDEAQGVLTSTTYDVDGGGSIAAGTPVNSHMIFLNPLRGQPLVHESVTWLFDGSILGVMSDGHGALEAASSSELGHPATNYITTPGSGPGAPQPARGLEPRDSYAVSDNALTVSMRGSDPGDWLRVVTAPPPTTVIPLPATLPLALVGLAALGWFARRRPLA